ncbi:MAG: hypothetical protein AB7S26_02465 [Sandaracinaceae bacterium]
MRAWGWSRLGSLVTIGLLAGTSCLVVGCGDGTGEDAGSEDSGMDAAVVRVDGGDDAGPAPRDGGGTDAAARPDGGSPDGGSPDAAISDGGPGGTVRCTMGGIGECGALLSCECCGGVGPAPLCYCTTTCLTTADCTDPARPICDVDPSSGMGICRGADNMCCWACE